MVKTYVLSFNFYRNMGEIVDYYVLIEPKLILKSLYDLVLIPLKSAINVIQYENTVFWNVFSPSIQITDSITPNCTKYVILGLYATRTKIHTYIIYVHARNN